MKLLITLYQDEDGVYIAECPAIPGCVSQGATEEEVEDNITQAIKECLAIREENELILDIKTWEIEINPA